MEQNKIKNPKREIQLDLDFKTKEEKARLLAEQKKEEEKRRERREEREKENEKFRWKKH